MALIKLNNRAVKDIDAVGSIGTGDLVFISKQTASSSASISFTSGIDSTYKEYVLYFVNIHAGTDRALFQFQGSTDSGSNYNTTATTTYFQAYHTEDDSATNLGYNDTHDDAQTTGFMNLITHSNAEDNEASASGYLHLYNPSSTTFVKHFTSSFNHVYETASTNNPYSWNSFKAGYFNTTSAIDALQFKFSSGNIDSGDILLYGVN
jgi:hypothetical protein